MITIYTDGSSRGNPGPGGYAAVINSKKLVDGKEIDWITEIGGKAEHTTNNRMELMAAIKALEFLTTYSLLPTTIYTDSEYVMKGITEWVHKWQIKGWKTAGKKKVLNQDLWQELLRVAEDKNIEWKYVEGHSGDRLNDRCDEIATSFADLPAGKQEISPPLYDGPKDQYR